MKRGFVLALLALLTMSALGPLAPAAQAQQKSKTELQKLPDLNGVWSGPGLTLRIDMQRHQGNADPSKPFNRQSLLIRNVTGPMVVFAIGPELFVAQMLDQNQMSISRGGRPETYLLTRRK